MSQAYTLDMDDIWKPLMAPTEPLSLQAHSVKDYIE